MGAVKELVSEMGKKGSVVGAARDQGSEKKGPVVEEQREHLVLGAQEGEVNM